MMLDNIIFDTLHVVRYEPDVKKYSGWNSEKGAPVRSTWIPVSMYVVKLGCLGTWLIGFALKC